MIKLGVNIDHVATIRQARRGREPDPVTAAAIAEASGADGITIHLREDRRHIQDRDAEILRKTVKTRLNLEMAIADPIVDYAVSLKPDMATLVPERREEVTTEGGLDVVQHRSRIKKVVKRLKERGILVSLFVNPEKSQVEASRECGSDWVEFNTGRYSEAIGEAAVAKELELLLKMADFAGTCGLKVNAGHGLNYWNVAPLVKMKGLEEFNIGHSIISRAVFLGLGPAVQDMKKAIREAELFFGGK